MTELISSTEVGLDAIKLKSTKETLIVGTRTENPSNFPASSGNTSPTAAAAPVIIIVVVIVLSIPLVVVVIIG